ncbi:MAG: hypothetical protein KGZ88_18485, partial [Methylomicrobium sp.]|nr:hypothetical protein [Methylomicrobium sp.]
DRMEFNRGHRPLLQNRLPLSVDVSSPSGTIRQNLIITFNSPMKLIQQIVSATCLVIYIAASQASTHTTPDKHVSAFLGKYHSMRFSGLPNDEQAKVLASYLSPRLNELLQNARQFQQDFKTRYPTEKPPLVEGDIFSSLFEGATSFEISEAAIALDSANVLVTFSYAVPQADARPETWSDRYKLIKMTNGSNWLIDDVEYLGQWDFAPKGQLSESLKAVTNGQ